LSEPPRPKGEGESQGFSQPGKLFRLMSPAQQAVLFANTARALGDAPEEIKVRHIGNCLRADPAYGKGVAGALGIALSAVPEQASPSRRNPLSVRKRVSVYCCQSRCLSRRRHGAIIPAEGFHDPDP
jgi:hypothetical protein